ncbi:MAG: hypothetical protein MUO64_02360 [Anaerolineales bacterium]|nr:hypothetical protein [Anaerolineales bacterium]
MDNRINDFLPIDEAAKAGANLEAGKAMMRRKIEEAQAQFTERSNP